MHSYSDVVLLGWYLMVVTQACFKRHIEIVVRRLRSVQSGSMDFSYRAMKLHWGCSRLLKGEMLRFFT